MKEGKAMGILRRLRFMAFAALKESSRHRYPEHYVACMPHANN